MRLTGLQRYFPATIRERAAPYAQRVRVLDRDDQVLHAHVIGTEDYCLRLQLQDGTLKAICSCPYFELTGPCKHLWAVLQHAQRTGAFSGTAAPDTLIEVEAPPRNSPSGSLAVRSPPARKPRERAWQQDLAALRVDASPLARSLEAGTEIVYLIDVQASMLGRGAHVDLASRSRKRDGAWAKPRPLALELAAIPLLLDENDRELVPLLTAIAGPRTYSPYATTVPTRVVLPLGGAAALLTKIFSTGRAQLRIVTQGKIELVPCAWDDGPPYRFVLVVVPSDDELQLLVRGEFRRGDERIALREHVLAFSDGLVVFREHTARLAISLVGLRWIALLGVRGGELRVPNEDGDALAVELRSMSDGPPIDLPERLRVEERRPTPRPTLRLRTAPRDAYGKDLIGELLFDYEGILADDADPRPQLPIPNERAVLVRELALEQIARARLLAVGLRRTPSYPTHELRWTSSPHQLGEIAATLGAEGWRVEADGKLFRAPGAISVSVRSGIDWFDLEADVAYGEVRASLPQLLAAVRRGERYVSLGDGSLGLLPEAWLARHRLVGELGKTAGDALRFSKNQIGVLDALLTTLPEAQIDRQLARARTELARFGGIEARDAPAGFVGTLRGYQREGLGWLEFLRTFGFGGCLADDMGLGKTIQVLALLEGRRGGGRGRKRAAPSLVVVPKSLVFNWRREAARFTPKLRVLEHHGLSRSRSVEELSEPDLIVTTYGTMIRDIALLRQVAFDYVILDEAQAIKNPHTEGAKAVRLLQGQHRLALTGTPIENRLSDLWSLFEFLNPGMLGASEAFKRYNDVDSNDAEGKEARALLAKALRPFILRRGKAQVAPELPQKTEQIIYCELEGKERQRYDELRAHYRTTLLGYVDEQGIARSQMHILEALLRLRQAACHPGLIDPTQAHGSSAKLGALLAQLDEIVAGGHKALVFSQFTSLLGIVRHHLDGAKIRYEYLDGKTRDRQAKVDRFQSDPDCPIFLVSLKAGGVGLNLTAAEYVFLLDPWWNPAVEAQAIDRTHRIGQSRPVIAYRLIGRDTIEEKVLALQAQKRDLADTLVTADNAMLSRIGREELDLLLS